MNPSPRSPLAIPIALSILAASIGGPGASGAAPERAPVRLVQPVPGQVRNSRPAVLLGQAVVNFSTLAQEEPSTAPPKPRIRSRHLAEVDEPEPPHAFQSPGETQTPFSPFAPSPAAGAAFMGLDDVPMADSSYIIIPPDTGGSVGLTRLMQGLNNNYRIFDKSDGSVISTVGTATFWAPSGETALNGLTDPRTLYDPFNDRWITVMQTVTAGAGNILVGVSQTSDPSGNWNLYRFATNATIDFPIVGFNKNWIAVSINRYGVVGNFQRGITLVVDYPQARAGTGSGTLFTQSANTHFCSAPCATYSSSQETLYVVNHLTSSTGTYSVDRITGTPSAPVYTSGGSQTRPGGGWVQPGGQILPQSAPNSGTSGCGATPCRLETQDAQVRSAPVFRDGLIYYTQTVGLPAGGLTHTGVQWTILNTPSGAFFDGLRIEDATATSTNGGKWYAYPHIAVNSVGDFIVGYSQFSSAQHPSAGYSMRLAGDSPGTIRDPVIYKSGEDYYHKDFGSGRNRWGDYSQAQVDPSDDRSLWTVQEYGKTRVNTNDGGTGANGSRWSTYWANVPGPAPTVAVASAPSLDEGDAGLAPVTFTVGLSTGYSLPVTVGYQTVDGTATAAGGDYEAASGSITIPAGELSGTITVYVVGDATAEPEESFDLALTFATNGVIGSAGSSTVAILNDDLFLTINASAGANGSISPSGIVSVTPGANQSFTVTPDTCFAISDVLVDGVSVGAVESFDFTNVSANRTIAASFTPLHSLSIGEVIAAEGNSGTTDFAFPVSLTGPCEAMVQVSWQTEDGTASASAGDYAAESSTLSFAPGETSGIVTVHVAGDLSQEEAESFLVNLSGPVRAGIGDAQGVGTILNDDTVTAAGEASPRELSFGVEGGHPIGGAVRFRLEIPAATRADLSVYDIAGRRVARLVSGAVPPGVRTLTWNPRDQRLSAGSGVYFARFTAGGRTFARKFVLLR